MDNMDIALECRQQAAQCAAWLEVLAGEGARVRVVTSSGSLAVSSNLLQLFSPLVRSAISSLPPEAAQEPVIVIPNTGVSTVRHFMNILTKGQIDYSELIFIPTADKKRKFCDVMKKNIVNLAKCLQVNIRNFSMNSRHPLKNTIDNNIERLKVRRMEELLRPEVIREKSEAEAWKAGKQEAWPKPGWGLTLTDSIFPKSNGKFPSFNFNVNNNKSIVEDGEIVEEDVSEINSELQPSFATAVNVEVEISRSRSTAVVDHQCTETSESPATEEMEASPCAEELVTSDPSVDTGEPKCTAKDMATDEADTAMTVSATSPSSTEEAEHSVASVAPEIPEASSAGNNSSSSSTTADNMAADSVWRCRDNPEPYECSVCRAKYDSRWGLSYHLEFQHNLGILNGNFVFNKGMASFVYETCPRDAKSKSPTHDRKDAGKEKEAADSEFRWCQLTVEVGDTPCAICKSKLHSQTTCPHKHENRYGCNPYWEGVMIKCAVCCSYSHMAYSCPHSERKGRNPRSENGYWKKQCLYCKSYDHLENCKEVDSERFGRNPRDSHGHKYRCNQCGSYNHLAAKCVHTLPALAGSKRRCLYCGSYSHSSEADCRAENDMVRDYLRTRLRVREQQRNCISKESRIK